MAHNHAYLAGREIFVNGVRGYMPGDGVPSNVVEDMGLLESEGDITPNPDHDPLAVVSAPVEASDSPIPSRSASKQEWVAYAMTQGVSEADANEVTKDELIERFGE